MTDQPKWTKADIARVQFAIDCAHRVYRWPAEYIRAFPLTVTQVMLRSDRRDDREGRAAARLAARLLVDGLPEQINMPRWAHKVDEPAPAPPAEPPTPTHDHPLTVRLDERLAYPVAATTQEKRFVVVQDWRAWGAMGDGSTEYDAPREHWHAWAAGAAAELGAAKGWATIADGRVDDGHPAAVHVRRVLCEAAARLEPPAGIVALDLRGLGLHLASAVVQALVAAADARLARDGWVRCGVLICDPHTALYLGRCARLYAGQP